MRLTMDKSGRLVVPKDLRDAIGMPEGGEVDVSSYGDGLHLAPRGRTARVVEEEGHLVLASDRSITDEDVFALIDAIRK